MKTWIRLVVALFALWYLALGAFKLAYPKCTAGTFDMTHAMCRVGAVDYGPLYQEVVTFSFLALAPLALTFAILLLVLETGMHKRRADG